jgi:hypothetical protein
MFVTPKDAPVGPEDPLILLKHFNIIRRDRFIRDHGVVEMEDDME